MITSKPIRYARVGRVFAGTPRGPKSNRSTLVQNVPHASTAPFVARFTHAASFEYVSRNSTFAPPFILTTFLYAVVPAVVVNRYSQVSSVPGSSKEATCPAADPSSAGDGTVRMSKGVGATLLISSVVVSWAPSARMIVSR